MQQIFAIFFSLFVTTNDAEALLRSMPGTSLTIETASEHIAAARIAGTVTEIDPDILLALAYRESHFDATNIGPLVRGKHACGVLQHTPVDHCPDPSIYRDYMIGAQHLAEWLRSQHGDLDRALVGYAGGYALLELCAHGEATWSCKIGQLHRGRAKRLKIARERGNI